MQKQSNCLFHDENIRVNCPYRSRFFPENNISKFLSKIYFSCVCRTHNKICQYTIYFANIIRLSAWTYSNVVSLGDYADMK